MQIIKPFLVGLLLLFLVAAFYGCPVYPVISAFSKLHCWLKSCTIFITKTYYCIVVVNPIAWADPDEDVELQLGVPRHHTPEDPLPVPEYQLVKKKSTPSKRKMSW